MSRHEWKAEYIKWLSDNKIDPRKDNAGRLEGFWKFVSLHTHDNFIRAKELIQFEIDYIFKWRDDCQPGFYYQTGQQLIKQFRQLSQDLKIQDYDTLLSEMCKILDAQPTTNKAGPRVLNRYNFLSREPGTHRIERPTDDIQRRDIADIWDFLSLKHKIQDTATLTR